jgi:hypothetical protein
MPRFYTIRRCGLRTKCGFYARRRRTKNNPNSESAANAEELLELESERCVRAMEQPLLWVLAHALWNPWRGVGSQESSETVPPSPTLRFPSGG